MRDPRSRTEPRQRNASRSVVALFAFGALISCATPPADPNPPPFGPPELTAYRERFYSTIRDAEARPTEEAGSTILSRRILLFGDRHDDTALHEELFDPVTRTVRRDERPILILEGFSQEDDEDLQSFREDAIDYGVLEQRLLARNPDHWIGRREDIDRYMLLYFLRVSAEHDCPIYGLEALDRPPLTDRVEAMERRIRDLATGTQATRVIVWVGQAHTVGPGSLGTRMTDDAVVILGTGPGVLAEKAKSHELILEDHAPVVVLPIPR